MPVLSPWATFSMQRRFYMPPEGWTQVAFIRPAVNKCMDCGDPSLGRCLGRCAFCSCWRSGCIAPYNQKL